MWWRVLVVMALGACAGAVLLVGLLRNRYRIDEGPMVLVLDASRGWGLHHADLVVIAIAVLPVLVAALVATVARLLSPGHGGRGRPGEW